MKLKYLFPIAFASVLLSCGETKAPKETKEDKTVTEKTEEQKEELPEQVIKGIIIESAYATNTASPIENYSIYNTIDDDSTTMWRSGLGAGLGEGLMFRFAEPVYIGSIFIEDVEREGYDKRTGTVAFCDGVKRELSNINTEVKNVFIRFDALKSDITFNTNDYSEFNYQRTQSDSTRIGIHSIYFLDKKGDKIVFNPPQQVNTELSSSSTLEPEASYSIYNIIDGKNTSGWAEGNTGNGVNEKFGVKFDKAVNITHISIWNGYQRSGKHFNDNCRLKKISIESSNGTKNTVELKDIPGSQKIEMPTTIKDNYIDIKVLEVYEGEKYKDLVLSEIKFYDRKIPIETQSDYREKVIKRNKEKSPFLLSNILDKQIVSNTQYDGPDDNSKSTSILLRSDNSFVCTFSEIDDAYQYYTKDEQIAEGNWELKSSPNEEVTIRVFGKMYTSRFNKDPYEGNTSKEDTRIFQDYITITKSSIKGKHFIEEIKTFNLY